MKSISIFLGIFSILTACNKKATPNLEENNQLKDSISLVKHSTEKHLKDATEEKVEPKVIVFTVQIAALQDQKNSLKKFKNAHVYKEGNFTKYRIGHFNTYKEARNSRRKLLASYPGAFVQALQNNVPIHISKALE